MTIKGLTKEQQILLDHLDGLFDITAIVPLFFCGTATTSEFYTYAATKLYMYLKMSIQPTNGPTYPTITLYNQANAVFGAVSAGQGLWNGTTAVLSYMPFSLESESGYFSRIVVSGVTYFKFIGYKITIT